MKSTLKSPYILVPPALFFFFYQLLSWNFIVDDAYISFRYAKHLAEGYGLVYNPGELPVEGYTNFLWTLILSIVPYSGLSFESFSKGLGILSALGASIASGLIFIQCVQKRPNPDGTRILKEWAGLAIALTLANAAFILWAGAGLEAPLFAFLLSGSLYFVLSCFDRTTIRRTLTTALFLVLLSLCRPEAAGFALLFTFSLLFVSNGKGGRWSLKLIPILCLVIVNAIYFYWRYRTYNDLLPNTFYAKVGSPTDQLWRGLSYLGDYFSSFGGLIWLVFILFAWRALSGKSLARIFLFGTILLYLAIIAVVGGDALPMYRFMVPIVPILSALLALGTAEVFTALHPYCKPEQEIPGSPFSSLSTWLILIALTGYGAIPAYVGRQAQYVQADRERMQDRIQIGKWLKEHYPGKTIALNAAGAIPFYSELNTIDMLGLNDRHIARRQMENMGNQVAGHEKFDEEYVLSKRPDLIFIGRNELTLEPRGIYVWLEGDKRLMQHPVLKRDYQPITLPIGAGFEYFTYYLRKDHPQP